MYQNLLGTGRGVVDVEGSSEDVKREPGPAEEEVGVSEKPIEIGETDHPARVSYKSESYGKKHEGALYFVNLF